MSKKVILAIVLVFLLAIGIYQSFFKKEELTFNLAEVSRGNIFQEVSETGQVKKGEAVYLSFENAGKIEEIYVEVGQNVERGELLAKLETTDLSVQLKEAQASSVAYQAQLDKLLAGASPEEIKIAQTEVKNSQIALDTAKQNLEDAYQDALNVLDDSYLKAYNAFNEASSIQRTYFNDNDFEGLNVKENKTKIENAVDKIKLYLDKAKADSKRENIDEAISETKNALSKIADSLAIIREMTERPNYRNIVSSTDKTSLDTQRTNINTALTNVTNSQQTISSKKLSMEAAEGTLQVDQDQLALVIAPPRQEDINLYQAQVDQAQAQVEILENQIAKSYLRAPVKSQITDIKKRVGELVQPTLQDNVVVLSPAVPYEIKVDLYEEDVVKVKVDNPVDISLVAFPEKTFKGRVVTIDPAEKIIEGVVYYETTIIFEEMPEEVKVGMTADLIIKTATKENVLIVPEEAIQKKNGKTIVEVFEAGEVKEREIEIGLQGKDDLIEVISGLKEGEKVILK